VKAQLAQLTTQFKTLVTGKCLKEIKQSIEYSSNKVQQTLTSQGMDENAYHEVVSLGVARHTLFALVSLPLLEARQLVHLEMLLHVALLREGLPTVLAGKRFDSRVHADVVEEIVRPEKLFIAVLLFSNVHGLFPPFGRGVDPRRVFEVVEQLQIDLAVRAVVALARIVAVARSLRGQRTHRNLVLATV